MSEYKEIPEWKKKLLTKNGKIKRDRTKTLRNQHKKSLAPETIISKEIVIPTTKVSKLIEQVNSKNKLEKEKEKSLKKRVQVKTKVSKLVDHYEKLIKKRSDKKLNENKK